MPNQFLSPEGDLENYFITEYWLIDQWVGDTLMAWGNNDGSQLGNLSNITRSIPITTFSGGTNWKQVACGWDHAAAIKTDGTLWVWGTNYTALGTNETVRKSTPVTTFAGGANWKQVSCHNRYNAAIKTDGTLWTWGSNSNGQLGNNTATARTTPVTTFAGGTNWKQVSCGGNQVAAIKTDGTLWTWGTNSSGQVGDNTTTARSTPVTTFAGGNNWKQVSCGDQHTVAIKTNGTLWTWGKNNNGIIGDNTTTNRITPVTTLAGGTNWKQVSGGYNNTAAIKTDGTLWIWGRNAYGQLGINLSGATNGRTTPVTTFAGGTNWKQVFCGYAYNAAIKTDGTLWSWGANNYLGFTLHGALGTNDTTNRPTPVTTFAGGTNWKQVACSLSLTNTFTAAVTSGTDPTFFIA